jgi:hypothetical protein
VSDDLENHLKKCTFANCNSTGKTKHKNNRNSSSNNCKNKESKINDDFEKASMNELCLMVLEKEREIEKYFTNNKNSATGTFVQRNSKTSRSKP